MSPPQLSPKKLSSQHFIPSLPMTAIDAGYVFPMYPRIMEQETKAHLTSTEMPILRSQVRNQASIDSHTRDVCF